MPQDSPIKTIFKAHKLPLLTLFIIFIIFITVVIFTTISQRQAEDAEGFDDSRAFEYSINADQYYLSKNYGIFAYLPITSVDPSFTIFYDFDGEHFSLTINAFTASARSNAIKTLLSTNFGPYDPLDYPIIIENYFNPLLAAYQTSKETLLQNLPSNFTIKNQTTLPSGLTSVSLTHQLYDGSTNTYHLVLDTSGIPLATPSLIYSYSSLPTITKEEIKLINSQD